ncbi:hypothetical protein [Mucilaginibacter aquatilis]|uniref:DUF3168 domain-containing protein n=1 Tax=Mucilaginibacter aquatilis TaxID=1517760 RepID=A0A6I4I861_9SPHI|nr:hypothetical protein [Mucilaginibacter aquatilis]MVN89606.1 hypothetical protein [Mucilaginibacter aquatilis]
MPIRYHISKITQTLSNTPGFAYGTANELNQLADDKSYPCVFMYPLQGIDMHPSINGSVSNTFSVYLEFLYKTDFGQYTADNETYVTQALALANEFLVKAAKYTDGNSRYFKITSATKAKCTPVYNKYDVNTTGVGLTLTLQSQTFGTFN